MNTLVHFFGLKRSGNHAVINWLQHNAFPDSSVTFHNCVYSPLSVIPKIVLPKDVAIPNGVNESVLLSYEDIPLNEVTYLPTYEHDEEILPEADIKHILLLRDPYNFFASRLKRLHDLEERTIHEPKAIQKVPPDETKQLWLSYAKEFMRHTHHFNDGIIPISYNHWFTSKPYRDRLLHDHFGVAHNTDIGINEVPSYGRGSSFDYEAFDGHARDMRVLDRWQLFEHDPVFRSLAYDPEVQDLADTIFGSSLRGVEQSFANLQYRK